MSRRVFLLSPANCGGERAPLLCWPRASFDLALRLRTPGGAPLGEVMSFVSGLYFRGKLTYATRFGVPLVITPHAGLRLPDEPVTLARLRAAARVDIHPDNPRYRRPLLVSARAVASALQPDDGITLLGSIASDKYVTALLEVFGEQRGDVLVGGDAAEQRDAVVGLKGGGDRARGDEQRPAIARVVGVDVHARRRPQARQGHRLVGQPQAGVRRDDERHAEPRGVGELAAEIEAGDERHHLAERRPAGRAEAQGQVEARARREEQLRALAAAVGGGEHEDASGHRGYGVGGVVSRRIGQAMAVLRITDRYNPCSSGNSGR